MRGWWLVAMLMINSVAKADVFIVTSNAGDHSAGTFGEALDKASNNGTAVTDTILFNLPHNIAGRTIQGNAYYLSSNLVIDGSSQPGAPFGVSDAKVHIVPPGNFCTTALLMYSVSHIEMYGLWVSGYNAYGGLSCFSAAMKVRDVSHITIGKSGKGNVFSSSGSILYNDWSISLTDTTECDDIILQSNFFGIDTAGMLDSPMMENLVSFGRAKNITIGGTDPKEGNLFGRGPVYIGNEYTQPKTDNGFISVISNTFNLDYSRQHYSQTTYLLVYGRYDTGSDFDITIRNNTFGHDTTASTAIQLNYIQNQITITDNELGFLDDGIFGSNQSAGVTLQGCSLPNKTLISHNSIHGYTDGIAVGAETGATISQNSIYCNKTGIFTYSRDPVQAPLVMIKKASGNVVSGTACALCKIELFNTTSCPDYCENGQQYIGETTADNTGNFTYATNTGNQQISATSTNADGTTSAFDGPRFDRYDFIVANASCGRANGSVTGITVVPAGTPVYWEDTSGKAISNTTDLSNVPAGVYRAYVLNPTRGCRIYSPDIYIDNEGAPQANDNYFSIESARCSGNTGSIIYTGYHPANTSFTWFDKNKTVIRQDTDSLQNLSAGTYYAHLIPNDDNGCYTEYGPFTIIKQTDTCTGVKISGPANVCFFEDTSLYFTGIRNAGCTLPVEWSAADLSASVANVNDSVTQYHFTGKGATKVIAHIAGYCREFLGSLTVQLYPEAGTVDLGMDKTICAGSQIVLSAPGDMALYTWQDKTTSQAYTAGKPGQYYVTATDYCGNQKSDTVLLSSPSVTSFSFQPQYIICSLDTVRISLPAGTSNYAFSPATNIAAGNGTLLASPSSSLQYTVQAISSEGCDIEDKLSIRVYQPAALDLGGDASVCEGQQLTLKVPEGFISQLWNTGSSASFITASSAGDYSVTAEDSHQCKASDTVRLYVNPLPVVDLGKDRLICEAQNLLLNAGNQNGFYLWQDGSTAATYLVNQPGIYWISVTNAQQCTNSDTIAITGYASLPSGFIPETDSICAYETKELKATGSWASYQWNTGSVQPTLAIQNPGLYWLTVQNETGCAATDTIRVFQKQCLQDIYVPSAFSPNGDGRNDMFKPVVQVGPVQYFFAVYNRFGQNIFSSVKPGKGWNGTDSAGSVSDTGAYVWICTYQLPGQTVKTIKGTVVLVR